MVIWFNIKEARQHLLKHKCVYTLRPNLKRQGQHTLMYDKAKQGRVFLLFLGIADDEALQRLVHNSGFNTVEEWRKKAKESRYLYRVDLLE